MQRRHENNLVILWISSLNTSYNEFTSNGLFVLFSGEKNGYYNLKQNYIFIKQKNYPLDK